MSGDDQLSDEAVAEFQTVIERFKKEMQETSEKCLRDIYCDLPKYLETDSWLNYRGVLRSALSSEVMHSVPAEDSHWARQVRAIILKEHYDVLAKSLDLDLRMENQNLRDMLKLARESRW